jgi:microcystin-dependent protein
LENPSSSYGVPAGTIIAFAGQGAPKGNWVLCNGGILKDSPLYHDLYLAIGTAWGNGDQSAGSFNLPDLRGQFLRGQVGDGIATIDADRDSRINKYPGGTTGNHVGSYELDKVGPHDHKVTITLSTGNDTPGAIPKAQCSNTNYAWPQYGVTDGAGIGKETRPMNAYVAFYIKF